MDLRKKQLSWLIIFAITAMIQGQRKYGRVVCYYANWSVYYKTTYKFTPKDIEPQLCTHLVYAFGTFTNETTLAAFDSYQDINMGGYVEFTGRKRLNPELKTMISVGGWNEGSGRFSDIASDENRRKLFTKNTIEFLRQNDFDGLDIDWQYPGSRDGSRSEDRENYVKFIQTLSEEFVRESVSTGRSRLLLSITVPLKTEFIVNGFDIVNLNRHVDWMNLVSYNYHTAYESIVNHHSPLYDYDGNGSGTNYLNVNFTVGYYLEVGADPQKLNLGIPLFGLSFRLTNPNLTEMGSLSDGPGISGNATSVNGYLAYFEICQLLFSNVTSNYSINRDEDEYEDEDDVREDKNKNWKIVPSNVTGPYAYKGNQWLCYDDTEIVKRKAKFAAEKSLGGIMFWTVDNDDYFGSCHGETYPIIKAAKRAFYSNLGSTTLGNRIDQNGSEDSTKFSTSISEMNATTVQEVVTPSLSSQTERLTTRSASTTPPTNKGKVASDISSPVVNIYIPIVFPLAAIEKPHVENSIDSTPIKSAANDENEKKMSSKSGANIYNFYTFICNSHLNVYNSPNI